MDSVYSLGCSTLALIMAGVSLTQLHMPGADRVHEMFKDEPGLDECGGKPSLRTFCNDGRVGYEPSAAIFLWLIVLMALWCVKIYFLVAERRASPFAMKKANRASDASAAASIWTRPSQFFMSMCGKLLDLAMWGMQLTLAVYVGSSIDMFGHDPLVQQSNVATGGMGVWNVGQVTAMLIWLPMIAKYLYTLLCKSAHLPCSRELKAFVTVVSCSWCGERVCDPTIKRILSYEKTENRREQFGRGDGISEGREKRGNQRWGVCFA